MPYRWPRPPGALWCSAQPIPTGRWIHAACPSRPPAACPSKPYMYRASPSRATRRTRCRMMGEPLPWGHTAINRPLNFQSREFQGWYSKGIPPPMLHFSLFFPENIINQYFGCQIWILYAARPSRPNGLSLYGWLLGLPTCLLYGYHPKVDL